MGCLQIPALAGSTRISLPLIFSFEVPTYTRSSLIPTSRFQWHKPQIPLHRTGGSWQPPGYHGRNFTSNTPPNHKTSLLSLVFSSWVVGLSWLPFSSTYCMLTTGTRLGELRVSPQIFHVPHHTCDLRNGSPDTRKSRKRSPNKEEVLRAGCTVLVPNLTLLVSSTMTHVWA